jgi:hypothetical protein
MRGNSNKTNLTSNLSIFGNTVGTQHTARYKYGYEYKVRKGLGYGLDDSGFELWQGHKIYLFSKTTTPASGGTQPPIQWAPGPHSLGVKRPVLKANAEVRYEWRCLHSTYMPS